MVGYPRVIGGHYPGTGIYGERPHGAVHGGAGYVIGEDGCAYPIGAAAAPPALAMRPAGGAPAPVHGHPIHQPPWRDMNAPGSPPLGEGHVPMPLNPEAFNGTWGAGGAGAGVTITFSARPQKPFKTSRFLITGTKFGPTAIGRLVGQMFVGTDLQQGELGNIDLESLGAGGSFDTWVSLKQAEPGVWIRVQATLTAFPVAPDFETFTVTAIGHYLH